MDLGIFSAEKPYFPTSSLTNVGSSGLGKVNGISGKAKATVSISTSNMKHVVAGARRSHAYVS